MSRDSTTTKFDVDLGTVDDQPGPRIGTTATDAANGDHEAYAGKVEIIDTIAYRNLEPGREYTVTGKLMDKETGKPVQSGEKDVTATASFVPDKPAAPSSPAPKGGLPKAGDSVPWIPLACLAAAAACGIAILALMRRKDNWVEDDEDAE